MIFPERPQSAEGFKSCGVRRFSGGLLVWARSSPRAQLAGNRVFGVDHSAAEFNQQWAA